MDLDWEYCLFLPLNVFLEVLVDAVTSSSCKCHLGFFNPLAQALSIRADNRSLDFQLRSITYANR